VLPYQFVEVILANLLTLNTGLANDDTDQPSTGIIGKRKRGGGWSERKGYSQTTIVRRPVSLLKSRRLRSSS